MLKQLSWTGAFQANGDARKLIRLGLAIGVLSASCLSLISCDTVPSQLRLGVSKAGAAGIRIHFVTCGSERILDVALLRARGEFVDDPDDEVLWRIQSSEGSQRSSFIVGHSTDGFSTAVQLTAKPLPPAPLSVAVHTTRIPTTVISFDPGELTKGLVLTRDGTKVTVEEFLRLAREKAC